MHVFYTFKNVFQMHLIDAAQTLCVQRHGLPANFKLGSKPENTIKMACTAMTTDVTSYKKRSKAFTAQAMGRPAVVGPQNAA